MLEKLKEAVCEANLKLVEYGLVIMTWGNVSAISEDGRFVVIKPSGVDYSVMEPGMMTVVDMDGSIVEGELRPSSDLPTHLELYRSFAGVRSVVHTHSLWATSLAQAELDLPCYGTTHADTFHGSVPCTRALTQQEIDGEYELNTGKVIVETFRERGIDPVHLPAVLCASHGPFTWGKTAAEAVYHAAVLEEVAKMGILTLMLDSNAEPAPRHVLEKHFLRKHGPNAYYGQG